MTIFQKLNSTISSLNIKWSNDKIYIVPNINGFKLLFLFLFVLTTGLIYANNYLLFFSFLIFFILMFSIISTHSTILSLDRVVVVPKNFFANESDIFTVSLTFKKIFTPIKFKLKLISPLIEKNTAGYIFKDNICVVSLQVRSTQRGKISNSMLKIETAHPFGWFNCFKFIEIPYDYFVYPTRLNSNTTSAVKFLELLNEDKSDLEMKNYVAGESPNRIVWKKNYLTPLQIKAMVSELHPNFYIDIDLCKSETDLSLVCNFLLSNFTQESLFSFKIRNSTKTGSGSLFLKQCLEELAVYEI